VRGENRDRGRRMDKRKSRTGRGILFYNYFSSQLYIDGREKGGGARQERKINCISCLIFFISIVS
jgi:hypothetical protein